MGRAERRRAQKCEEKAKTATYNLTRAQLDALVREKISGELDRVKQEATNDAINQAMILLLTLPLEVLMDHADAVGKGILGGADLDLHAVFQNVPLLRHIDTGQHVHQRGLAAPVFSEEAQDLAALDGQVHAVVGNDLAKALCDVDQFNFAVRLQSGHPFLHGFAGEFA